MKYPYADEGVWQVVRWRQYGAVCCHCGLKHLVDFRVVGRQLQLRAWLDLRSTGQIRRWMRGAYGIKGRR